MIARRQQTTSPTRRGLTLVELLIVVGLMTILMAVAIPVVRPAFEDRQLREAARQVNVFCAGAKARAAEAGRPVGVWMEVGNGERSSSRLYMAEVPPPFTGALSGSRCTVDGSTGQLRFWTPWSANPSAPAQQIDLTTAEFLDRLTPPPNENEFFIRFDHKGPLFRCANNGGGVFAMDSSALVSGVPPGTEDPGGTTVPAGSRPVGQTFEIIRGPTKSIVPPLTLPGDAVIDLMVSGVGVSIGADSTANIFNTVSSGGQVIVMFSPTGQVGAVFLNNQEIRVGASLYFMIGRRGKVIAPVSGTAPNVTVNPDLDNPEVSNLADPNNLWVTINNVTGIVTTEDNAVPGQLPDSATVSDFRMYIKATREFARGSRQKGGQ